MGLLGLILPSVGLGFHKLRTIGDEQWIVLACVVAVGSGAFFWGNRHRLGFASGIAGGALALVPIFAYVSFWRHAKDQPQVANPVPMPRRHQPVIQTRPAPPPPDELRGPLDQLNVEIRGDLTDDELAQISEHVQDCLPDAQYVGRYMPLRKARLADATAIPRLGLRPVPSAEQFLAQITFGTVTIVSADRIQIEVRRPLPPAAESVRNRAAAALDALRSGDVDRQKATVRKLEELPPLARREEVAAELLLLFSTPKLSHSTYAAFKRWAVPEQAEAIKQLIGRDGINLGEVFGVLAAVAPDDAVRIARDVIDNDQLVFVLAGLGAPVEKGVIEFLQDPDPKVRKVGVEVLKSIGTEASIEPLKAVQNEPDATEARRAVGIIQGRMELNRLEQKGP
jgi:hypothetical protein